MKILIDDGMQIQVGTGIGKYSSYLFNELKKISGVDADLIHYKKVGNSQMVSRFNYIKYINSRKFLDGLEQYDTVHFTNYAIPFRKIKGVKYIVTIHDLVTYLYPETLPFFYRIYNKIMIKHAVYHADVVITVSKTVKNEIITKFPKTKDKIVAINNGVFEGIKPLKEYLEYDNEILNSLKEEKFFLFVGTIEKRKNLGVVIDAFIKLKKQYTEAKNFKLVLAGRFGFGYEDYKKTAESSDWKKDIIFTGYISESDCNRLYNSAAAFIFPSVYEGFGVPQLECMKCYLPIILSDIPTNREVSRDYGEFFSLNDIDGLIDKMKIFVFDQYDKKHKKRLADEYIKEFGWDTIAKKHIEIY